MHGIEKKANKVDPTEAANVKAAVDAALVHQGRHAHRDARGPDDNKFAIAKFDRRHEVHDPRHLRDRREQLRSSGSCEFTAPAAVRGGRQFCAVDEATLDRPFGDPPLPPECDAPTPTRGFVVLERDLGSLRVPPFVAFVCSSILFVLGLLCLHWRERDESRRPRRPRRSRPRRPRAPAPRAGQKV